MLEIFSERRDPDPRLAWKVIQAIDTHRGQLTEIDKLFTWTIGNNGECVEVEIRQSQPVTMKQGRFFSPVFECRAVVDRPAELANKNKDAT